MKIKNIAILLFPVLLFLGGCSKKVDVDISDIESSQVSMAVNAFLVEGEP